MEAIAASAKDWAVVIIWVSVLGLRGSIEKGWVRAHARGAGGNDDVLGMHVVWWLKEDNRSWLVKIERIRAHRRNILIVLVFLALFLSSEFSHSVYHGGYRSALLGMLPIVLIILGVCLYSRIANGILFVFHAFFLITLVKHRPGLMIFPAIVFQGGIFFLIVQSLRASFAYHRLKKHMALEEAEDSQPEEV